MPSRLNPHDLPGSMVVLGLVIENPNQTIKHIGQCIETRFARSRFSPSTAQTALERLAGSKQGWVRLTSTGETKSMDRYEATPKGFDVFRSWMHDLPGDGSLPVLREAMLGRVELCKEEDIPRIVELANDEAEVSTILFQAASQRLTRHRRRKIIRTDYVGRARSLLLHVDPMHWAARAEQYEALARGLENILDDMANDLGS